VDEAMLLLERMEALGLAPNVVTFSTLITACANATPSARVDEAMLLLERMEAAGLAPNVVTFSTLITACANAQPSARVDEAMLLLERMEALGLALDEHTLSAILKCCARARPRACALAELHFSRLIGPVRLNEHVERQLESAVGRERAATLRQWAMRERPECLLAPVRRGGRGAGKGACV
jgi:pentatricopeptide repeat protein